MYFHFLQYHFFKLNEKEFKESFTVAGLKEEIINELFTSCSSNMEMIQNYLEKLKLDTFSFRNLEWRVDLKFGSRMITKSLETEIMFKLDLQNDAKQKETHILQTDPVNLIHLTNSLEDALNEIKSNYCRRVIKNIV